MDTKEAIIILRKLLPEKFCNDIVDICNTSKDWEEGNWYNYNKDVYSSNTHSKLSPTSDLNNKFDIFISTCHKAYVDKVPLYNKKLNFYNMHFNRYQVGDKMDQHVDHIHSIFDGTRKGIPVLSMVGVLNNDFEGGNFVIYDNLQINLKMGDVVVFPSCFLYPHRVEEITKGTRYSWVSWTI